MNSWPWKNVRSSRLFIKVQKWQLRGPLPPPETLDGYEKTLPGAADRVFAMAEKEQSHRHDMEKDVNDKLAFDKRLAQTYAFTLTLAALSGAVYLLSNDKAVEGIIVFISSFAPIAKSYLDLKELQNNEEVIVDD